MNFSLCVPKLMLGALAASGFLAGTSATAQAQETRKPNIIFIIETSAEMLG